MKSKRYAILIMGVIMFLMMGFMYMWSSFQSHISTDLGFGSDSSVKWAYTVCMVCFSSGILLDGLLGRVMNARADALIGTCLIAAGYLASSVLTQGTRGLLYLTYGVLIGLGTGMCYNAWLSNVLSWFQDKRGFASGVLLLGMGLTGLTLMKFVVTPWLTAENLGWRFAFRVLGAAMLVIGLTGLLFIKKPKQTAQKQADVKEGVNLKTGQMLKSGAFWYFTGWKAILFGIGISVTGAVAGIVKISSAAANPLLEEAAIAVLATNAVAAYSLCNGLSRPVFGIIYDKLKAVKTMALVAAIMLLASAALFFLYSRTVIVLIIALAAVAMCYGASTALGPSYLSSTFGQKYYRKNSGVQALSSIPFTILGSQGISAVYDATGSYRLFFVIMMVCAAAAFVFALMCGPGIKKLNAKYGN